MSQDVIDCVRSANKRNGDLTEKYHVQGHDAEDGEDEQHVQDDTTRLAKAQVGNHAKVRLALQDGAGLQVQDARDIDSGDD